MFRAPIQRTLPRRRDLRRNVWAGDRAQARVAMCIHRGLEWTIRL
jgi:hypothetical protein